MKHINRLILLVGLLTLGGGYLTAQISLDKLPALLNDSSVLITIPQMDYLVGVKHSRESTYNMLMVYKKYSEDANTQLEDRLNKIIAQESLINTYALQAVKFTTNEANMRLTINTTNKQLKKARTNATFGWIASAVIAAAGTMLYLSK